MDKRSLGKDRKKAVIVVWACILLLCMGKAQTVSAEETLQIGIDQYVVTESGEIVIYVNHNGEQNFSPKANESTLLIGKNVLEIDKIQSFKELREPVTYLCLVDISGSMTEQGMEQTRSMLNQLMETMGTKDNICITTMGNDVESSGFVSQKTELAQVIENIEREGTEDTNLYYSITEAVNVLKTDKNVHKKRCLLIFSDGEDDQKKGITQKEAEDAVKDSHIPIFTVVLPGSNLKDEEESAKILGSFARISAGGKHYAPLLEDGSDYESICTEIGRRLTESLVIRANLEGVKEVGDDTVYIKVELSDGVRTASDGITVPAGTILTAIEAMEEAKKEMELRVTLVNENKEETDEGSEATDGEAGSGKKKILIGVLLGALVLLIVLIMFLSRRSKAESEEMGEEPYDETGEQDDNLSIYESTSAGDRRALYDSGSSVGHSVSSDSISSYGMENTIAPGISGAKVPSGEKGTLPPKKAGRHKEKITVTLFKVGPGAVESYQLIVKEKASIGRSRNCQLTLNNDNALSGTHCSILYREGIVFVMDEESTNGTFVNGVPIVGEFKVEQDDIVLIGSSEYRIVWE